MTIPEIPDFQKEFENIEPSGEDFRDAMEVMQAMDYIAAAIKTRNLDNGNEAAPFSPVVDAVTALVGSISDPIIVQTLPLLMRDPSAAMKVMMENGMLLGFVAGYGMAQAGEAVTHLTIPVKQEVDHAGDLLNQAKDVAMTKKYMGDKCECFRCSACRTAVEEIREIGVTASWTKIGGTATVYIDDKTVETEAQQSQVDEILGRLKLAKSSKIPGAAFFQGPTGSGEPEGTGLYL